jgi:hypothetical protein
VKRWFPRVVGVLAALVLVPIVAQAGVHAYVAWFLRQGDLQILERQVAVPGRGTVALRGMEIRSEAPLPTGWVVDVASDLDEIVVDLGVPGIAVAGQLYFRVCEDGESLIVLRGQAPTAR